jgi:hypothetical protein
MSKGKKVLAGAICALGLALVIFVLALFRGYFDHGLFEVKEVTWAPLGSARVAIVAERSDHDALNGDDYFVVIGDHVFSPTELRFAYYSDSVVFAAANECLSVRWSDLHNLTVFCRDGTIDSDHINVRKPQARDVAINYVNIADTNSAAK